MTEGLLMPKATAKWLIEHTTLTFEQIADFSGLHPIEVKSIADGEILNYLEPMNPTLNHQLSREEIARCEQDPSLRLQLDSVAKMHNAHRPKRKTRYTPLARRGDKPSAILWLIKYVPSITDAQIIKLIGTTKNTVESIRNRTHWNIEALRPTEPVLLGLCSQADLDHVKEKIIETRPELSDHANTVL